MDTTEKYDVRSTLNLQNTSNSWRFATFLDLLPSCV